MDILNHILIQVVVSLPKLPHRGSELKWLLQNRFRSETVMIQIYNGRIMYDIIAAIPQRAQLFVRV